jgi:hypothetical protein
MTRAESVHSTPPTNTPIDTTRRGFLGGTAAALTIGTAVNVAALAATRPAAAVSDPILAAIEAHKAAWAAEEEAHRQFSAFEDELADNQRLQYERRTAEESRRGRELEAARDTAFSRQQAAAIALLGVEVTTLPGLLALLQHVQKYDDATYCEAWPTHLVLDEEDEGTRPWHYYLVANLIRDMPAIMGRVA